MSQRSEIIGIQYLRGFCSVAVVLDHTSQMSAFPKYYGRTILNGVLSFGGAGVDIFFVISGFIICIIALQGEQLIPSLSRSSFFAKRFARIVPLMWLSIVLFLLLRKIGTTTEITLPPYVRAALLTPYGNVEPNSIWTLRHELVFYVVFAISFLGRRPLRWLMWAWLAASAIIPIATLGLWSNMDDTNPIGIIFSPINVEFAAGMLLGFLWIKKPAAADLQLRVNPFLLLSVFSILIMAAFGLLHSNRSVPKLIFLALMSSALIGLAVRLRCPPGLSSSFGRLLGNASYAIYLFHPPFVAGLLLLGSKIDRYHVAFAIPAIATLATGIGIIIHLLVEKPLVRRVQKWLAPKPAIPPIVVRG